MHDCTSFVEPSTSHNRSQYFVIRGSFLHIVCYPKTLVAIFTSIFPAININIQQARRRATGSSRLQTMESKSEKLCGTMDVCVPRNRVLPSWTSLDATKLMHAKWGLLRILTKVWASWCDEKFSSTQYPFCWKPIHSVRGEIRPRIPKTL